MLSKKLEYYGLGSNVTEQDTVTLWLQLLWVYDIVAVPPFSRQVSNTISLLSFQVSSLLVHPQMQSILQHNNITLEIIIIPLNTVIPNIYFGMKTRK